MNKDKIIFKNLILGSFFASFSGALGGSTFVFTRLIIDVLDPSSLSFLSYGLTGLILFLLSISVFLKTKFLREDKIPLTIFGLAMITIFLNYMAAGLDHTTAAKAGLLHATMPLCTILISFFLI